jgi:hypothetical protein
VDRRRLRKEADVIAQDQLDHQCLHEEKHNDIGAGNKMEMASDSVSPKGDMAKEDNMTQVPFSICFSYTRIINSHYSSLDDCKRKGERRD